MNHIQLILITPPEARDAAAHFPVTLAHPLYRLGQGGHLFRSTSAQSIRQGLMVIDDLDFDGTGDPSAFSSEVVQECLSRRFSGVILSFGRPPVSASLAMAARLSSALFQREIPLYLPEAYEAASQTARILISSAISGGSLHQRLLDAVHQYGRERIVLDIERVAADFTLPSPDGKGTPLTQKGLRDLRNAHGPSVFFSNELCSHYFTYMNGAANAHFVLFDDLDSLGKKLHIARSLGLSGALLFYPEIAPWADALFQAQK